MLVCDTSGLFAYFDESQPEHELVRGAITEDHGPWVVSPYVAAELDYLVSSQIGTHAELAALYELSSGAWDLPSLAVSDLRAAANVIRGYRDQNIRLAHASLVVLADRYRTDRVLTLDHRRFRVLRTLQGGAFKVLPA